MIATFALPLSASDLTNTPQVLVTCQPLGAAVAMLPNLCPMARWDSSFGSAPCNHFVAGAPIITAIGRDLANWPGHLVEEKGQHLPVTYTIVSRRRCLNIACFLIHREVDFAPSASFGGAMLAHFPFALTKDLQARAIYDKMHRLCGSGGLQSHRKPWLSPTESAVTRDGHLRAQEGNKRTQQAFGGPQRQTVHFAQSQSAGDGLIAVAARQAMA